MSPSLTLRVVMDNRSRIDRRNRNGMALLVVVVLVMLIALGAYRFSFYMESQYRLTRWNEEQVHARLAALSGVEMAAAFVEMPPAKRAIIGGLFDNPISFRGVSIDAEVDASALNNNPSVWRFSLVSPRNFDSQVTLNQGLAIRFGLENESAKLHIPTLLGWDRLKPGHARATLLSMHGVNESMVDTWLRELGGTAGFERSGIKGQGLQNQHASLDELRHAWFGGDLNQNYLLDPLEARLANQLVNQIRPKSQLPTEASNLAGELKPLRRYLTWRSGQRNENREGQTRIYLNEPDLASLHRNLSAIWSSDWANFVIALRQFGPNNALPTQTNAVAPPLTSGTGVSAVNGSSAIAPPIIVQDWVPDFSKSATFTFRSPLDLVGVIVELPTSNPTSNTPQTGQTSAKRFLLNPFSSDLGELRNYLGKILDDVTVDLSTISEGRIDASEAPVEVLAGVPGLDLQLAQRIVQQRDRSKNPTQELDTIAWLLEVVELAKLKELEPYLTCRSDVYSVQAVGYRDNRSAVYRTTVTIDSRQSPTQLLDQRVWHPWDRGFTIEQLSDSTP